MPKFRPATCAMGYDELSRSRAVVTTTNLHRSSRGLEVVACSSRRERYSVSSVLRSCAIDWVRASSWRLLACACSTDDQMNLSVEKAGAREGRGARDKQWCMMSIVERGMWSDHIRRCPVLSQIGRRPAVYHQAQTGAITVE